MEIRTLQCFASLAQCLNFTKAAELHHISQTAMSRKISSLEDELGIKLFQRNNRQVTLTTAGQVFYIQTLRLLNLYDTSLTIAQNTALGITESLEIGIGVYEHMLIRDFMVDFHRDFPDIHLNCRTFSYPNLIELIEQESMNIIITSDQEISHLNPLLYRKVLLCSSPWKICINEDNPLAKKEFITADDLSSQTLITMAPGSVDKLINSFQTHFTPRSFLQVNSYGTKLIMVNANYGVALLPPYVDVAFYPHVVMKDMRPLYMSRAYYAVCRKNPSKTSTTLFMDLLEKRFC